MRYLTCNPFCGSGGFQFRRRWGMRPAMRTSLICLFMFSLASSALAQDWNLRSVDAPLGHDQARALTAGTALTFYDDGQSRFSVGGAYSYTYANSGSTAFGVFRVEDDGRVCIDFRNGHNRCDLFVRNGGVLVMLTEKGERFPIRIHLSLKPWLVRGVSEMSPSATHLQADPDAPVRPAPPTGCARLKCHRPCPHHSPAPLAFFAAVPSGCR